ncbi:unnamed protein product [Cuscuta epithymum]|uniref:Uncharacterized protein n=1 Tax=Cuscuta epithymum TaxID=186058 RepID=A0AAV0C5W7_9ASTE|nr:unnamed protein product [Cuscuta epithymum]CAH9132220.1 unnamed protein product [Cuscuta epithymum]
MDNGSKLYMNKPKKSQLKQHASSPQTPSPPSVSPSMTSSNPTAANHAPPPPPAKEPFLRRYRFIFPMLLAVNLAIGGYLYMRTKKKDTTAIEIQETPIPSVVTATESATIADKLVIPPALQPVREPISEKDKRDILKWMLEEKRKLKPKDPEEKRRIDEDKAILKQFIRAKSIPNL